MNNFQSSFLEDTANTLEGFYTEYGLTTSKEVSTIISYYLRNISRMPKALREYQVSIDTKILELNERYVNNDFAWREKYVTLLEKYQKLLESLHQQEQL